MCGSHIERVLLAHDIEPAMPHRSGMQPVTYGVLLLRLELTPFRDTYVHVPARKRTS